LAAADHIIIELTRDDLLAINNALNEVCHGAYALPDWEFPMLMGVERAEAQATLKKVGAILSRAGS